MKRPIILAILAFLIFPNVSSSQVLQNFEIVGNYFKEGYVSGAVMIGDTLYYNAGVLFQIVDLSNPQEPVWLGSIESDMSLQRVFKSNQRIITAGAYTGLNIVDATDPLNPQITCKLPIAFADIVVRGNIVFALSSNAFFVYDNSDPDTLIQIGQYQSQYGRMYSIVVDDSIAIICGGGTNRLKFEIVDVSNLSSPQLIRAYYDLYRPGPFCAAKKNHNLYFGGGMSNSGYVFSSIYHYDITDLLNPVLVDSSDQKMMVFDLIVQDTLLYAAANTLGLRIFRLDELGSMTAIGVIDSGTITRYLDKKDNNIICSDGYYGVKIVNVSNASNPVIDFSHDVPGSITGACVKGDYLFLTENSDTLRIFDLGATDNPTVQIGSCYTRNVDYLFMLKNMLFGSALYWWAGIGIFDISNLTNPKLLSRTGGIDIVVGMNIKDNYLLTPFWADNGYYGLKSYDISDPSRPLLTGRYDFPVGGFDIALTGDIAYMTYWRETEVVTPILDISHIPTIVGVGNIPYPGTGARTYGRNLFLSALGIYNIENPEHPSQALTIPVRMSYPGPIEIVNGYCYIEDASSTNLQIWDVGGFSYPESLGAFNISPSNLLGYLLIPQYAIKGNLIYCANGDKGLTILRYTGPMPINTGDANNSGTLNGLDVAYLVSYLRQINPLAEPRERGDTNGDCVVNGLDVVYLVNYFKGSGEEPIRAFCYGH